MLAFGLHIPRGWTSPIPRGIGAARGTFAAVVVNTAGAASLALLPAGAGAGEGVMAVVSDDLLGGSKRVALLTPGSPGGSLSITALDLDLDLDLVCIPNIVGGGGAGGSVPGGPVGGSRRAIFTRSLATMASPKGSPIAIPMSVGCCGGGGGVGRYGVESFRCQMRSLESSTRAEADDSLMGM